MWEISARILACGVLVAVSGWFGAPPFEAAWKIAALVTGYAFLFHVLELRKLMNPGIAGLGAGLDALAIGAVMGYAGLSGSMGFLVLAPVVYAVVRRGSNPLAVGSIGAAALLFGHTMAAGVAVPEPAVLGQTAAVFAISLLCNHPRVVVRPKSIKEMIAELGVPEDTGGQALIELREKYRRLTTSYRELERKTRSDRISAKLLLARNEPGDLKGIVEKLKEVFDVRGVILYLINQAGDRMVITAEAGAVPKNSNELSFAISASDAAHHMKDKAGRALMALRGPEDAEKPFPSSNVLLRARGRVLGMMTLICDDQQRLEESRERAEEVVEAITHVIGANHKLRSILRRLAEAELLYEIVCRLDGAATEADLGRRAARALAEVSKPEHVGVWMLDGTKPTLLGKHGKSCRLFDHLRFDNLGLEGWLKAGAPTISAYATSEHEAVDRPEATRQRIGGYIMAPIKHGDDVVGFLTVGSATEGKLGPEDTMTLEDTAAELAYTLARLRKVEPGTCGLVSIAEFQREILEHPAEQSSIVYIEPLHFEEMEKLVGHPAVELAGRQLGLLIRRHAPESAQVCRKADGSYVVLLPEKSFSEAEEWAGTLATYVSMRAFEGGGLENPIPLAVRARAAELSAKPEESVRNAREVA